MRQGASGSGGSRDLDARLTSLAATPTHSLEWCSLLQSVAGDSSKPCTLQATDAKASPPRSPARLPRMSILQARPALLSLSPP